VAQPQVVFTPPDHNSLPLTGDQVYDEFFHGPAYQVIERMAVEDQKATAIMAQGLPANSTFTAARSLLAPRLVELCFQAAAQWSREVNKAMAFPLGFGKLQVYGQEEEAGGKRLYALLETGDGGQSFDADVVDEAGKLYVRLRDYRTVSRPTAAGS
jgi:hypothetical protein